MLQHPAAASITIKCRRKAAAIANNLSIVKAMKQEALVIYQKPFK
jgi:hypothetical protein